MSFPRSRFSNSSTWRSPLSALFRTTFERCLRLVIDSPFVAPHGPAADRPELVAAAGENERQPPASIAFSEQQPARLVVPGLDDTTREKDGAAEERLDIRCLDSVLLALLRFPASQSNCPAAPVSPPSHSSRLLSG